MEKIQLHSVLPQVFAQRNDLDSEIWKQDVTFEKGHLYLIEAESGSGKSTFCSYVLGYRHDYSGSVMFDNDVTANYKVKDWVEMRKSTSAISFRNSVSSLSLLLWRMLKLRTK